MRASAVLVGVALLVGCSTTPDTPENAVMDYLTAAQVGEDREARDLVCDRLRNDAGAAADENLDRLVGASVFGDGLAEQRDGAATVKLLVQFPPSGPEAEGDPWVAHLVDEGGRWKVCGFEPAP